MILNSKSATPGSRESRIIMFWGSEMMALASNKIVLLNKDDITQTWSHGLKIYSCHFS
jgi:hypothetical protein